MFEISGVIQSVLNEKKAIAAGSSYISIWKKWYQGKVPSFHRYYVHNGEKKVYKTKLSMHMAKQSCEDWASLLMNEKVKIVVKNQDELEKLLMDLDFWTKSNEAVELGFALSMCGLAIKVDGLVVDMDEEGNGYLKETKDARVLLNSYAAEHLVPITWENGECVECAFINEDTNKTVIQIHLRDEDTKEYVIYTVVQNKSGSQEEFAFYTGDKEPWFCIIHPRICNNFEINSPYPLSIFANAIDTLKSIDTKFDSYYIEFQQGKKRTFISSDLNKVNKKNGEIESVFDPEDTTIYRIPAGVKANGEPTQLIFNVTDTLRAAEHSQAIQDDLNFFSKQVGLGVDYYRFEKGRVMTATQVISEKSDTFRNMKKHEAVIEKEITKLIRAIMYASNEFTSKYKFGDIEEITLQFDDSIIEDKTTEKKNDADDVSNGIMSKVEFRKKWYGEDEETAIKNLDLIYGDVNLYEKASKLIELVNSNAMTRKDFVNVIYANKSETEKAEIVELLSKQDTITPEDLNLTGV